MNIIQFIKNLFCKKLRYSWDRGVPDNIIYSDSGRHYTFTFEDGFIIYFYSDYVIRQFYYNEEWIPEWRILNEVSKDVYRYYETLY